MLLMRHCVEIWLVGTEPTSMRLASGKRVLHPATTELRKASTEAKYEKMRSEKRSRFAGLNGQQRRG